jgi:hypothetical protein
MSAFLSNSEKSWQIEFAIALLLVVPGYWFGNPFMSLLIAVILVFWNYGQSDRNLSFLRFGSGKFDFLRYVIIPLLFYCSALLNKFVLGSPISQPADCYSSFLLLPFLIVVAWRGLTSRTILWIVALVAIEVAVSIMEYLNSVPSFFVHVEDGKKLFSKVSLYDSRVFGFASNSPIFAQRCFLALFLVQAIQLKSIYKFSLVSLFGVGIFLSFNRSVIIAVILYLVLLSAELLWRNRGSLLNWKSHWLFDTKYWLVFTAIFIAVFSTDYVQQSFYRTNEAKRAAVIVDCPERPLLPNAIPLRKIEELNKEGLLLKPITEGFSNLKLSGRELIWMNYVEFLDNHKLRGNKSDKLMLQKVNAKTCEPELVHAHNSILMILSMHGLIIGGLFLIMYLLWWRGKNIAFIAAVAVYSITQYGVFWGFSFIDVVFIVALIMPVNAYEYAS